MANTLSMCSWLISHDNQFVAAVPYLILEDDKVLGAAGDYREDTVASGLKGTDDGEHGGYTNTATGTDDSAEFLDVSGIAQRAHNVGDIVALVE